MSDEGFTIERLERQPILSIRGRPTLADAPGFFDRSYAALYAYVAEKGGQVAGPALSCTHERTRDSIDVEVAVPVREPVPGSGMIAAGEIPAVEAAVTDHIGSYTRLGETYSALVDYARRQGREPAGPGYEFYIDDPSRTPADRRRTRVALPLKE